MTTMDTRPLAEAPEPERERRPLWPLVAAAMVIVWVVGLVIAFGVVRPPALAALADPPSVTAPASLAWMAWDDQEQGSCVSVARPDGTVDEALSCLREGGELAGWTEDGLLIRSWRGSGEVLIVVDPSTGQVRERRPLDPEEAEEFLTHNEAVFSDREDGQLVVSDIDDPDAVLWRVDAPDSYRIESSARSSDGAWIAMLDSAERLLLVPADGSDAPRLWVDGATRWSLLVWEPTR
jgi:hypothetical protein